MNLMDLVLDLMILMILRLLCDGFVYCVRRNDVGL